MTALILDGRALAKTLREELRADVQAFVQTTGVAPSLAVVKIAGDLASERYARTIRKGCEEVGIVFQDHTLPHDTTQAVLEETLNALSFDRAVHGILLHLPLPPGFDANRAIAQIDPHKDVDGVHPYNVGLLALGQPRMIPNTPAGGMELLLRNNIPIKGQRATVVGRSVVVGKPMALLLLQEHATVTIAHSRTRDLASVVREADIVVAATGKPGLITGDMVKPGAVVVDFGVNVLDDGRVVGDVDFASVAEVASAITPVPGGTGPVTNVMLLRNVLQAARLQGLGVRG
ncbi:MAG: bifunctional 5,10-methylenetetrahydrofolate dehydrogenase/5,10-methenyltetrahydrofolate cyclohydrolase [Roseiflexus sp.]|nr:bifunctional 5,10-methylenetetrahydrofolate dehydrogenase/5,10-methenyltetrahydrofolate cyclohydrolase [Roseiflexus sp.]MCS7291068.1 bifunctional 5,10-methylenetetrahydrofolate dehydrogenase/5,10-methenyltetrahydrofolate cyclohydrolase [Roseiflexus sp.]MDW8145803.1 bifunctional 5,10-methylenetetrahydrofolate dehydrogenase/5,10-methenyltetrahydrofolate cyclohydrolase [Roseiflexaceae bacterium]MDW8232953.1 bifunctional 5,10-methylenetetrahydrofolate dehydrogenase/5,10-methenyltetrahydrofolate c